MKAVGQTSSTDAFSLSSCQWQLVKTHLHSSKSDGDDDSGKRKQQRLPRSRQKHSACRVGEFIYVFGGKDGTSPLKDVWKYHIYHQEWEMVEMRGGSLPLLQGHTTVAYKRLMVIFGGTFNNNVNDIQLWIFNTDLGHLREVWAEPGAAQPMCRRDHSAVIHNNLMYVFGGFKDTTGASQELWAFNIDEEEWTDLTHLSHCRPSGRYGHTAVVAENAMWIFGGTAGLSPCTDLWKYSFSLHQWTKLKCVGAPPTLSGHSACVIHHQMIVVGGNSRGKPLNDVWSYRFDTNTWRKLSGTGMPLPGLSSHTSVSVCPPESRNQQCTNRALSTPHLKPSFTSIHHPDRFLVRPHTSPSVMEETSPGHEDPNQSVSPDSQVMSVGNLGNSDSRERLDPRIDVSLKEPLVSNSPGTVGFYDSCIPFSPRHNENRELQELQRLSLEPGSDSANRVAGQQPCPCQGSQKAVTVDLIDLSDSPVLKASKNSFNSGAIRKEVTFWNDLFIEDLELSDDGGLDEVKIFYPSKHPVLPLLPCPEVIHTEGLAGMEDTSSQLWRNEGDGRRQTCISLQSQKHQVSPQNGDHCHGTEPQHLKSERMDSNSTKSVAGDIQLVRPQLYPDTTQHQSDSTRSDMACEPNQRLPLDTDMSSLVPNQESQCSPVNKDRCVIMPSQKQSTLDKYRNTDCELGYLEAETSFIDSGDSARGQLMSIHTSNMSSGHAFSGKTVASAGKSLAISSTVSGPAERHGVAGCPGKMSKGAGDCVKEEMVLEDPFLLVVGGKMEEQMGIHPKSLAVWKGLFG
ncbi:uncharacterized protein LOC143293582 [Babylonia areolata]|uniref:uncharacterized protein LOC143293582 n=1 Tax=Babylonia areolata TaxID=304850 RepID=UPI003FD276C8